MSGNSEDKKPAEMEVLYPHNPIDGFQNGCLLDLRVRLAVDFLKAESFELAVSGLGAKGAAAVALDLADELLKQGAARGWVSPLPDDGELTQVLRHHARRTAAFSVLQQVEGNRAAISEQSSIAVPVVPVPGRKMN